MERTLLITSGDEVLFEQPVASGTEHAIRIGLTAFRSLTPDLPEAIEFDPDRLVLSAIGGTIPISRGQGSVTSRHVRPGVAIPLDRQATVRIELRIHRPAEPDEPGDAVAPPHDDDTNLTHRLIATMFIDTVELAVRLAGDLRRPGLPDCPDLAILREAVDAPDEANVTDVRDALRRTRDRVLTVSRDACYTAFERVLDQLADEMPDRFGTLASRHQLARTFRFFVDDASQHMKRH